MNHVILQTIDGSYFQKIECEETEFGYQLYKPKLTSDNKQRKVLLIGSYEYIRAIEYLNEYGIKYEQIPVY